MRLAAKVALAHFDESDKAEDDAWGRSAGHQLAEASCTAMAVWGAAGQRAAGGVVRSLLALLKGILSSAAVGDESLAVKYLPHILLFFPGMQPAHRSHDTEGRDARKAGGTESMRENEEVRAAENQDDIDKTSRLAVSTAQASRHWLFSNTASADMVKASDLYLLLARNYVQQLEDDRAELGPAVMLAWLSSGKRNGYEASGFCLKFVGACLELEEKSKTLAKMQSEIALTALPLLRAVWTERVPGIGKGFLSKTLSNAAKVLSQTSGSFDEILLPSIKILEENHDGEFTSRGHHPQEVSCAIHLMLLSLPMKFSALHCVDAVVKNFSGSTWSFLCSCATFTFGTADDEKQSAWAMNMRRHASQILSALARSSAEEINAVDLLSVESFLPSMLYMAGSKFSEVRKSMKLIAVAMCEILKRKSRDFKNDNHKGLLACTSKRLDFPAGDPED